MACRSKDSQKFKALNEGVEYKLPLVSKRVVSRGQITLERFVNDFKDRNRKKVRNMSLSVLKQAIKQFACLCTIGSPLDLEQEFLKQV